MLDGIKKRLPPGLIALLLSGALFYLAVRIEDTVSRTLSLVLGLAGMVGVLFSVIFIAAGILTALVGAASMAALIFVMNLDGLWKLWGLLALLAVPALVGMVINAVRRARLRRALMEENPTLSGLAASEMVDALGETHYTIQDAARECALEMLDAHGQILLVYRAGGMPRTCRAFVQGEFLHLDRLTAKEAADFPAHVPKQYSDEDARHAGLKPCNLKLTLESIKLVSLEKRFRLRQYKLKIHADGSSYSVKSDGALSLDELRRFFEETCGLKVSEAVGLKKLADNPGDTLEDAQTLDEEELARCRNARAWVRVMNVLAAAAAIALFAVPNLALFELRSALCMLIPLVGDALYIKYCPRVSFDSNRRGAPNLIFVMTVPPLAVSLLFLIVASASAADMMISGSGDNMHFIFAAGGGTLAVWSAISAVLFIFTREYKTNKSLFFSIPFVALFQAAGLAGGAMLLAWK